MNTPALSTARLTLRRFTPDDLDALFAIYRDRQANRFLPWFPAETAADAARFLESHYLSVYRQPAGYAYALCRKADNIPIGYIKAEVSPPYDLGYGLLPAFWGKGYAAEAGAAVIAQLRLNGFPYITATHDRLNPGSGRVMQKLGMAYRYSYREQWQPKDIPVVFRMYQLNLDGDETRVYRGYQEKYPFFIENL